MAENPLGLPGTEDEYYVQYRKGIFTAKRVDLRGKNAIDRVVKALHPEHWVYEHGAYTPPSLAVTLPNKRQLLLHHGDWVVSEHGGWHAYTHTDFIEAFEVVC